MKIIKRLLQTILISVLIGIIFRGWIYRHLITYRSIGQRKSYSATNSSLIDYYNKSLQSNNNKEINTIIRSALSLTSAQLNYRTQNTQNDPNRLINTKNAHCVGYASFYATTCNYLLAKHKLNRTWVAKPQVGQLLFLGVNIHSYFSSPFFRDHDFVVIENLTSSKTLAVDPTVNDYLFIDFVTLEK